MASPKSLNLGVFPAGEIPAAHEHTFKDSNGAVIDLSGFTAEIRIDGPTEGATYTTGTLEIDADPTTGKVLYIWSGDEFVEVGKYEMIIWVGDGGTNRFGSYLVKWDVYDAPGELPTV